MHGTMLGSSLFAAAAILIVSHVEAAPVAPHGEMQIMPTSANDTQQHLFMTGVASTAAPKQYTYRWKGTAPLCDTRGSDCSTECPEGVGSTDCSFWTGFLGKTEDTIKTVDWAVQTPINADGWYAPPDWAWHWDSDTEPPDATNEFGDDCEGSDTSYTNFKVLCGYLVT